MRNVKIWKIVKSSNLGFTLKFPKNIFLVTFFQKKWMDNFWVIFWLFSCCQHSRIWKHRKMAIFWSNRHTHVWNSQFLGPLFVDLLDAKGHFSCFLKKVIVMGGNQKKVFFSLFFFWIKKIQKFIVFSPWDPLFGRFLDPKKWHFLWHQGKTNLKMRKSQNEKIWNLENCQILKS